jgi:hypothetical protein
LLSRNTFARMHTKPAKRLRTNPERCGRCPSAAPVHAHGLCYRCYQRYRRGSLPLVVQCACGESDVRALSGNGSCWNCVAKSA